jgi:predicted ATPase/DNA-binding SARP family transcriptional activator
MSQSSTSESSTSNLTLYLSGGFLIEGDSAPALLHSPRLQTLLAYLVLHCHEPQPRSQVAFALWPDVTDSQAHSSLRRALYRLRRAWPTSQQFLRATSATLHWPDHPTLTIDVRELLNGLEHAYTRDMLETALAWYRGPLLPMCNDEWLIAEREGLQQYWLDGLLHLVEQCETAQQYEQAILVARQLCRHAPLDERHYQRLMRLYMETGNQSAAIHTYRACSEMLAHEYGTPPSADTRMLYESLAVASTALPPPSDAAIRLPVQPTPFVGRAAELHALHQLFEQPACRLLTVLGPGGAGKTRLALQAAAEQHPRHRHGVVFVSLATAHSADDLLLALIEALQLTPQGQTPLWETLLRYLQPRAMLLLLDAFEHVLDTATLLGELLAAAPGLSLLVTSREALRIQWEQRFPLDGLALPSIDSMPDERDLPDAIALFCERARRIQPAFTPTAQNISAIATICRTMGGLPLGIEIAAALIAQMDCTAIVSLLQQQRLTAETTLRDVPTQQRSLYLTTAASWQRLSPDEQGSYRRLAPLCGHFSATAATLIAGADTAHLQRFVDASLLWCVASDWYQFHDVLREFAATQLAAAPDPAELSTAQAAHSDYYLDLLCRQGPHLHGSEAQQGLNTIQGHYRDIRAAWQWAQEHQQWPMLLRGAQTLGDFYEFRAWIQIGYAHLHETLKILEAAIRCCKEPISELWRLTAQIAYRVAWLTVYRGQLADAQAIIERGVQLAEAVHADWDIALTRYYLGHILIWRGQIDPARPHLAASWATFEAQGDLWYLQHICETYGEIALLEHDLARAQHYYCRALAYARSLGSDVLQSTDWLLLGRALFLDNKIEEAHHTFCRGLELARKYEDDLVAASCLVGLGSVATVQGRCEAAWFFFREGTDLAQRIAVATVMLHAAIGIAHLLAEAGQPIQAIELLHLVRTHPASDEEPRLRAQTLLDELAKALPPEQQGILHAALSTHTLETALANVFNAKVRHILQTDVLTGANSLAETEEGRS